MKKPITFAAAQLNLWVGDVEGNVDKIIAAAADARTRLGADLVAFPELCLIGYPPDDLLLRTAMPRVIAEGVERLQKEVKGIAIVVGLPEYADNKIYNAAYVIRAGKIIARYRKQRLPNYGVFDEQRHYSRGREPCVFELKGHRLGLTICEDIWFRDPAAQAANQGAEILININASPYHMGKPPERLRDVLQARAAETGIPILYVNCVGGQDELVFDGDSMAVNADGSVGFRAPLFDEAVYGVGYDGARFTGEVRSEETVEAAVYKGLVQSLRDYIDRNGFTGALIGASGGVDSALVLALATDALGPRRVWAVSMPSRYTAGMSNEDAEEEARLLGVKYSVLPIEPAFQAFVATLAGEFAGRQPDLAEENIQSRCRGVLLMALSNKFGHLVLTTSNKSELAVGYGTLYGDMAGGFAPIKDVYKTLVYRLARYRNSISPVIPERVITRPPTAELRPDQRDTDSLPPYEMLDPILEAYVESQRSIPEIVAMGYAEETVRKVASLVRKAEYKRRQAPPGPKITPRAFGRDRRYPITAVYGDI